MSSDRIKDQDGKDKTATTNQAIKSSKASQIAIWLLLGGAIVIAALVFASWFFGGERIPDYVGYPLEGEQKEAVIEQNSPLTDYVYLTANADFPRSKPLSKITIHHMAGNSGLRSVGDRFARRDVQASANVGGNWHVSDEAFDKLVELCVDICERNGIKEINYTGDTTGNLTYHGMFDKSTACPGPYMKSRMDDLANAINAELERG